MTITNFSTAGAGTWTCPAGVTSVTVSCYGGGGGSGGAASGPVHSGGAAGGQFAQSALSVTPGNNYSYFVGNQGTQGSNAGGNGGTGGTSWFSLTGSTPTTTGEGVLAKGGAGSTGGIASSLVGPGAAGTSSGALGILNAMNGGGGGNAAINATAGGGGGGMGGPGQSGLNGTNGTGSTGGTGGATGGGNGGNLATPALQGTLGGGAGGIYTDSASKFGQFGGIGRVSLNYTADVTAPTAPGQPSLSNQAETSVTLTWTAATDAVGVTNYQVFKDGVQYGSDLGNVLTANVTGLTSNTTYSFTIKAKDAAGNTSSASTARSFTAPDFTAPAVPDAPSLSLAAVPSRTVTVTVPSVTGSPNFYEVFRDGVSVGNAEAINATNPLYNITPVRSSNAQGYTVGDTVTTSNSSNSGHAFNGVQLGTGGTATVADINGRKVYALYGGGGAGTFASLRWAVTTKTVYTRFRFRSASINTDYIAWASADNVNAGWLVRFSGNKLTFNGGNGGTPTTGTWAGAANDTWYVIEIYAEAGVGCTVKVRDDSGNLLDTITYTGTQVASSNNFTSLYYGYNRGTTQYYDDIVYAPTVGADPTVPTFVDFTITSDGTFVYTARAQDASDNRSVQGASSSISIDRTGPGVPTGFTASQTIVTSRNVGLSWTAPTGETATSYRVYRGGSLIASPSGTSYTDATISTDGTYGYTVSSVDTLGNEGSQTSTANAVVALVVTPSTPSAPSASLAATPSRTVTVSWSSVGGATSYSVYMDGSLQESGITGTSTTVANVTDGSHTFKITATNAAGTSAQSSASSTLTVDRTPPDAPEAPTADLSASPLRNVALTWTPVTDASTYEVKRNGSVVYTGSSPSYTDTSVADGSYTYTTVAIDSVGNRSSASTGTSVTVDRTASAAISDLSATQESSSSRLVNLSWTSTGSVDTYTVYRGSTLIYTGTATTTTDTPVADGSYGYTVYSTDTAGNLSSVSNTGSVDIVTIPPVPSAPSASLATAPGRTVTVSWTPVSGAASYKVSRSGTEIATGVTDTSYEDTSVADGSYTYRIAATGSGGTSSYGSASSSLVVYRSIPAVPETPTAEQTDSTSRTITVSWEGTVSGATGINVYRDDTLYAHGATSPTSVYSNADGSHSFTLSSYNANGESAQTDASNEVTIALDTPDTPTDGPSASLANAPSRVVTVTWNAVPRATSYTLRRGSTVIYTGSTRFYQDSPVDGTYVYTVTASNVNGTSAAGPNSNSVVVHRNVEGTPNPPTASLASVPSRTVTVTWDSNSSATGYKLHDQDGTEYITTSPTKTLDLEDGTWTFTVAVITANGTSPFSDPSDELVVDRTVPDAPTSLGGSRSGSNLTLTWATVSDATAYDVFQNGALIETVNNNTSTETLENQGSFTFSVRAVDAAGNKSSQSSPFSITYFSGVPDRPVLSLHIDDMDVTATWPAVSGAAEYVLYRDDVEVYRGTTRTFTETLAEGIYIYDLTAADSDDNVSQYSLPQSAIVSDGDPGATVLDVEQNGKDVDLSWSAVSGASAYEVTRNGSVLTSTGYLSLAQHNLAQGSYTYSIRVRDAANNFSEPSNEITVTVSDTTPPNAPDVDHSLSGFDVTLTWNAQTGDAYYEISRDGIIQDTVQSPTFTQTVLEGTYVYTVQAIDTSNNRSAYSEPLSIHVTDTVAPDPVHRPTVTVVTGHTVKVEWDGAEGATTYIVYRNGGLASTVVGSTSYMETLVDGTFSYTIVAEDAAGNLSAPSGASVITLTSSGPVELPAKKTLGRLVLAETSLGHAPLVPSRQFLERDF